jgi:hypothetical protein
MRKGSSLLLRQIDMDFERPAQGPVGYLDAQRQLDRSKFRAPEQTHNLITRQDLLAQVQLVLVHSE